MSRPERLWPLLTLATLLVLPWYGMEDSSVVILDWKKPEANKFPLLSNLPSTRVRLAFFDHSPTSETPTYQVGMRYWQNGVADNLAMDFGDFVMNGVLNELTPLPHKC